MKWNDIVHDTNGLLYTLAQYVRKFATSLLPESQVDIGQGQTVDLEEYIKVVSKDITSYAVLADGVKTYKELLNVLYVLLPSVSTNALSLGFLKMDDGRDVRIYRYTGYTSFDNTAGFTFICTYINDTGVHNDMIILDVIRDNSKYYKAVGNTVSDMSLEIPARGSVIEINI